MMMRVKSRFFFFSDRDMGTSRFFLWDLHAGGGYGAPRQRIYKQGYLSCMPMGLFPPGWGQAVEEEDGFEQIAVYDQVQLPLFAET